MAMSEAAKAAKRAYDKQYRATHKELEKARRERYWERKAIQNAIEHPEQQPATDSRPDPE